MDKKKAREFWLCLNYSVMVDDQGADRGHQRGLIAVLKKPKSEMANAILVREVTDSQDERDVLVKDRDDAEERLATAWQMIKDNCAEITRLKSALDVARDALGGDGHWLCGCKNEKIAALTRIDSILGGGKGDAV